MKGWIDFNLVFERDFGLILLNFGEHDPGFYG